MERVALYLMSALLLLFAAFVTFRVIVRRDYERLGRLRPFTGFLELLVWSVFVCIPSIYDPPDWWWPWTADDRWNSCCGCCDGGAWNVKDIWTRSGSLVQVGLYRASRNPQIVGGALMVVGVGLLWPSWFALGWVVLYGCIGHMMVVSEEEHLRRAHGEAYERYCERVPRYVGFSSRTKKAVA